jgi:hypothetical protein
MCFVDYLSSVFKNAFIEWDVKTITAGDYSCELDISQEMWDNFLKTVWDVANSKTKVAQFRDYLENTIEERLTQFPDLGYEEQPPDRVEIAMITFAFDNAEFINLLRERGLYIKTEKYDKMREVNLKIDNLKSKEGNIEKLNRPVTAFISFENEEGINRAKNYKQTCKEDPAFAEYK